MAKPKYIYITLKQVTSMMRMMKSIRPKPNYEIGFPLKMAKDSIRKEYYVLGLDLKYWEKKK